MYQLGDLARILLQHSTLIDAFALGILPFSAKILFSPALLKDAVYYLYPMSIMIHLFQMSDSFAECQEYIQKQQQEIMRLKLQHALELKVWFVLRIPFSCVNH